MTQNGQLITPGQNQRLVELVELVKDHEVQAQLAKKNWTMLAMYQRTDQIFEGEMRLVYVFGKLGR